VNNNATKGTRLKIASSAKETVYLPDQHTAFFVALHFFRGQNIARDLSGHYKAIDP
jgi:hypothetical protein